jgi:hypothetical protein
MWQILKAEFHYTKHGLMIAYTIAIFFFIAAALWRNWGVFGYMANTAIIYFITMGIIGAEGDNEKRVRYLTRLPFTPQQLGLIDLIYVTLFQLGMFLLWAMLLFFKPHRAIAATFWGMFSLNGLLLSLINVFIIHTHLGFYGTKKYKRITYAILFALFLLVIGLVYLGYIKTVAGFLWHHFLSASGALASTLLWLGLSYLSLVIFVRRKSYLA